MSSVAHGIFKPELLSYQTSSMHEHILKPSDISKLESSDVVFYIDDELETFVQSFSKKGKKLIQLSQVVTLLPARPLSFSNHAHGEKDLHIWLSPENAKLMILLISKELSRIDERNSYIYHNNAMQEIEKIDKEVVSIRKELNDFKGQKYIVTHDAYQYFEQYFGLRAPSAILEIGEDSYIGMQSLMKLKKIIKRESVKCIVSNVQENTKAFSSDIKVAILDPMGSIEKDRYSNIIHSIAQNFRSCFE